MSGNSWLENCAGHGGGPLGIRLGVPNSCDLTFDTGHSKLSEISLVDDDIQVANVDRAHTII